MVFKRSPVLVASLVLLVAGLTITPKFVGGNLRAATTDTLFALIPPETMQQLEITETDFQSGWFGSSALFDVNYSPLGMNEDFSMTLEFEFSHGPLMWTSNGIAIGLAHATIIPTFNSQEITEALSAVPFELPEVKLNLLAGFDESLSMAIAIDGVEIEEADVTVSFAGLAGNLIANPDQSAEFALSMGALSAGQASTGIGFNLQGLALHSETEQMSDLLAPSFAELSIPAFSTDGPVAFSATDISANSVLNTAATDDQLINVEQQFAIAELASEIPVSAFSWTSEINEIPASLIRSYYELLISMQNQLAGTNTSARSVDELSEELTLILLKNALSLNNYIVITAYDGEHSLDILTDWQGMPQLSSVDDLSIEAIIAALNLQLNLSLDFAAVMRSPLAELVDPYVQQGYLQLDNGRVLLELTISNSELVLNGNTTSLNQFFPSQNI